MKAAVFWDVAMCSLVDAARRFREAYCCLRRGNTSQGQQSSGAQMFIISEQFNYFNILCFNRNPENGSFNEYIIKSHYYRKQTFSHTQSTVITFLFVLLY
jgi:hypothetical protein